MAYTVTRYKSAFGNKRVVGLDITADAATQAVESGLKQIEYLVTGVASATTLASMHFNINVNASGVAAAGFIGISGLTSGDHIFVQVYGR